MQKNCIKGRTEPIIKIMKALTNKCSGENEHQSSIFLFTSIFFQMKNIFRFFCAFLFILLLPIGFYMPSSLLVSGAENSARIPCAETVSFNQL